MLNLLLDHHKLITKWSTNKREKKKNGIAVIIKVMRVVEFHNISA